MGIVESCQRPLDASSRAESIEECQESGNAREIMLGLQLDLGRGPAGMECEEYMSTSTVQLREMNGKRAHQDHRYLSCDLSQSAAM